MTNSNGLTAEPLVALWAKWHDLESRPVPEELTVDEEDRFTTRLADEADAVALQIIAAPAKTLIGAYAQIALLKFWTKNGIISDAEDPLGRLHDSIESALQEAAKGGAS